MKENGKQGICLQPHQFVANNPAAKTTVSQSLTLRNGKCQIFVYNKAFYRTSFFISDSPQEFND